MTNAQTELLNIAYKNQRFHPLVDQQLSLSQAGEHDHKKHLSKRLTGWGAVSKRRTHKQSPTQLRKRSRTRIAALLLKGGE